MAKVIVFGVLDSAELSLYYLTHDSDHEVVAFTVSKKYLDKTSFHGLPVVPFEDLEKHYSPSDYKLFAPLSARNMNKLRESIYLLGKEKGYEFISYVSSKATVCHNEIGENCFILEDNTLQPFTKVGNNVVMWSGNHIGHHGEIKDHVFFTSHVVLSGHCVIQNNCFLGVNSTIRDGIELAKGTLIAMSSSVTKSTVEPWGVYVGNPAKKKGDRPSYEVY